jgi:small ligand-binding sensory domain FIST
VVDVVDRAVAVADVDQGAQHIDDVRRLAVLLDQGLREVVAAALEMQVVVEDAGTLHLRATDATVELHAADGRQVVAFGLKNRFWNRFSAASLVGGSPGRIMR